MTNHDMKRRRRAWMACGVAAMAVILAPGHASAADKEIDVKGLWQKHCLKCHGADGKGNTRMGRQSGAKDYTDEKVQNEMKEPAAMKVIQEGLVVDGKKKMDPYGDKLTEGEQKALFDFMRAFGKKKEASP